MKCSECQTENDDNAKFCMECGAKLTGIRICHVCKNELKSDATVCPNCNTPVDQAAQKPSPAKAFTELGVTSRDEVPGERKYISVLFADIKGSTELTVDMDPEEYFDTLSPIVTIMLNEVHAYGGTVIKVEGDGIMALFGAPVAYEDHPLRACLAGLSIQQRVKAASDTIKVRIGINSGITVLKIFGSDQRREYDAGGQSVVIAARLVGVADAATVLIGEDTYKDIKTKLDTVQVTDKEKTTLKGLESKQIQVYQLKKIKETVSHYLGIDKFPYIDRNDELNIINQSIEQAKKREGQIICLNGGSGQGKSRCVFETFKKHQDKDTDIKIAACSEFTKVTPYFPFINMIKEHINFTDSEKEEATAAKIQKLAETYHIEDERFPSAVGYLLKLKNIDPEWKNLSPVEKSISIKKSITDICLSTLGKLSIIVLEELHWADDETIDLLKELGSKIEHLPIVIMITYRSPFELPWKDLPYFINIHLENFSREKSNRFIRNALGEKVSSEKLEEIIYERSLGNPFFTQELIAVLRNKGVFSKNKPLTHEDIELATKTLPISIMNIVEARIDNLTPAEKKVLQFASVAQKNISLHLMKKILKIKEDWLYDILSRLQEQDYIFQSRFDTPEYSFRQALVKDSCYASMLKMQRARYHEAIIQHFEEIEGFAEDQPELLAFHALLCKNYLKAFKYSIVAGDSSYFQSANFECIEHYKNAVNAYHNFKEKEKIEYAAQICDICLRVFHTYFKMASYKKEEWEILNTAKGIAENFGGEGEIAKVLCGMSLYFSGIGDFENCEKYSLDARKINLRLEEDKIWLGADFFVFHTYRFRHQFEKMIPLIEDYVKKIPSPETIDKIIFAPVWFITRFHSIWYLSDIGKFSEAEEMINTSEYALEKYPVSEGAVLLNATIGIHWVMRGEYDKGIPYLKRGLEIIPQLQYFIIDPPIATFLGYAYGKQENTALSRKYLTHALHGSEKSHFMFLGLLLTGWLSEGFCLLNEYNNAETIADLGLELSEKMKLTGVKAHCLRMLANIGYKKGGDARTIREQYKEAINLALSVHMMPLTAHCYLDLSNFELSQQQESEAKDYLDKAEKIYNECGLKDYTKGIKKVKRIL